MRDHSEKITLRMSDCDANGHWKLSSVLTQMQELGESNSTGCGVGRSDLIRHDMCWVLYRLKVQFFGERPTLGDTLTTATWPGGLHGVFFLRYYQFHGEDGRLIGEAATTWVLFDIKKRRVLRPTALPTPFSAYEGRSCSLGAPDALAMGELVPCGTRTVRFTELDMNGHMNNARYADWAEDEVGDRPIRSLQINFIAEARLGEEISLSVRRDEGATYIEGRREGEARAVFEIEARE